MSVSRHPIALTLEERVDDSTLLLATVMALPLLDGIFPALVLAGVMDTPAGILETGILIFGGSATIAVILAEMDQSRPEIVKAVLLIGAVIVPLAAIEAALAPTLAALLDLAIFERFAGLVILTVAAKTASSTVGEYLPSPGIIVALGLVASIDPAGAEFVLASDPGIVVRGTAAAAVGVLFALAVAVLSPQLRGHVDIDRFRFGSAVALGVLALPILGVLRTDAPIALAVLGVTALFAYDPGTGTGAGTETGTDTDDASAVSEPSSDDGGDGSLIGTVSTAIRSAAHAGSIDASGGGSADAPSGGSADAPSDPASAGQVDDPAARAAADPSAAAGETAETIDEDGDDHTDDDHEGDTPAESTEQERDDSADQSRAPWL